MNLFNKRPALQVIDAAPAFDAMGDMIREAMSYGALRIWQHTDLGDHPKPDFEVKIIFKRASGSKVEAAGRQTRLDAALSDAIAEARRLQR